MTTTAFRWTIAVIAFVGSVAGWLTVFAIIDDGASRSIDDTAMLTVIVLVVCFFAAVGALALLAKLRPPTDDDDEPEG